jgi:hypothetical protein
MMRFRDTFATQQRNHIPMDTSPSFHANILRDVNKRSLRVRGIDSQSHNPARCQSRETFYDAGRECDVMLQNERKLTSTDAPKVIPIKPLTFCGWSLRLEVKLPVCKRRISEHGI